MTNLCTKKQSNQKGTQSAQSCAEDKAVSSSHK